jgi:hypothetical protein
MARAQAKVFKVANPAGWTWTFDRLDVTDGVIDNVASAANPNAALDAIKPLIGAMPGSLSTVILTIDTFEP